MGTETIQSVVQTGKDGKEADMSTTDGSAEASLRPGAPEAATALQATAGISVGLEKPPG